MKHIIWIVTFFIILAIGYYWIVVDEERISKMQNLETNDENLSGDVNSTLEVFDRLEKKWIGTSKHVQTLQRETHAHYRQYQNKMDSIDIVFEEIKFSIEQLEEVMTRKIDRVKDDLTNVEESFDSFKRTTNRTIRELKQNIGTLQDDVNAINDKIFGDDEEEKK